MIRQSPDINTDISMMNDHFLVCFSRLWCILTAVRVTDSSTWGGCKIMS
jgi:hypothetical protein